jgi:signal transduction histidine kinase
MNARKLPSADRTDAPRGKGQASRSPRSRSAGDGQIDTERKLRELSLLQEFAQLATRARDWDDLMRTLVDRTTLALGVEVCSFYLLERDGSTLTLAATNGLDKEHVGRVHLAVGEGVTGLAAAERRPVQVPDVRTDPHFKWIPGFDVAGLTSMLSVPLTWDDRLVGVLNVQTADPRVFPDEDVRFLQTIAALLAGIVEKGRVQAEAETQLATLTALDQARAELLSVVTHELRTPLAIVRAYLDLLADAASGAEDPPARASADDWRTAAVEQVTRLDRLVDSILAAVRGDGLTKLAREPFDVGEVVTGSIETLALVLRPHKLRWSPPGDALVGLGDEARFRQVLEHLLENESKYAPKGEGISLGAWREDGEIRVYVTDDGQGVPASEWESVFEAFVRVDRRHLRGSGIGLYAARRLMQAMGGRVWIEANGYGGSRFVVALPEPSAATPHR